MPLAFAALPLGPADLRALADGGYSIIDQALRTPGLLIVQAPGGEAHGDRRSAFGEPATDEATASTEDRTPSPERQAPAQEAP